VDLPLSNPEKETTNEPKAGRGQKVFRVSVDRSPKAHEQRPPPSAKAIAQKDQKPLINERIWVYTKKRMVLGYYDGIHFVNYFTNQKIRPDPEYWRPW